ncbi:MAG: nucleoside hydrolase [Clostridia bacterium]|nr:nucleoside hydrolase [Clostridia bacterium]
MSENHKVLMDMDIGDDIDDAIALYSAMQQGFDIIGITTVFQNTAQRAKMAKKMTTLYGHGYENTPVYAGFGVPLAEDAGEYDRVPHFTPDAENYLPDSTNPDDAVDFIIKSCHTYGQELTIIAIGPFTNLARVIEKDPEALKLCEKVCIMGGAFYKQYADWNIMCDVEAADLMFRTLDNLECLGADVTHLCVGDDILYDALLNYTGDNPARRYLQEMCTIWQIDRPNVKLVLHDPLVVHYLANPALCSMQQVTVAVLSEGFARGMSLNVDAYGKMRMNQDAYKGFPMKKCRVAKTVKLQEFLQQIHTDFV